MTLKRLDWKNGIVPKIKQLLQDRRSRGIPKASIRGIFYNLISKNLVPNVPQVYKGLSKALVKAREDEIIPDHWIVDESRSIIDIDDQYRSPEELIDDELEYFDDLPNDYKDQIPRWHNQLNYVEIWIEKNAMAGVFQSIIDKEGRQVRIVPKGGWSSRTFWVNNVERILSKKWSVDGDVVVLYFGDYDPSGSKMVKKYSKRLRDEGIVFIHVAITKEQIRRFHLEHLKNTDPVVLAKLKRDKNAAEFRRENNGELFQIELDALDAINPSDLRNLILDEIKKLFNQEIYESVLNDPKHQPEAIRRLVSKKLIAYAQEQQHKQKKKKSK